MPLNDISYTFLVSELVSLLQLHIQLTTGHSAITATDYYKNYYYLCYTNVHRPYKLGSMAATRDNARAHTSVRKA